MSDWTPTPEQKRGIETIGRSLLVSAAAGSGKTAVLAARCAYLVTDANPRCDVDQLLVVTFTEAAAAEMKSRIERVLREKRDLRPNDERLQRQEIAAQLDRRPVAEPLVPLVLVEAHPICELLTCQGATKALLPVVGEVRVEYP